MIPLTPLSGTFWRVAFADRSRRALEGITHPEGRFHHRDQAALYASPTPEAAAIAVRIFVRPGDGPRVIVPLRVDQAQMADLRDPATCEALGIDPKTPSVPWADQRAAGKPATSWLASDKVRATPAHGMIYASRSDPARWHIVMFRWNQPGAAQISIEGAALPWPPAKNT